MLNRYTVEKPYRGFESLRLRHFPSNRFLLIAPGFRPLPHPLTWFDGEGKNARTSRFQQTMSGMTGGDVMSWLQRGHKAVVDRVPSGAARFLSLRMFLMLLITGGILALVFAIYRGGNPVSPAAWPAARRRRSFPDRGTGAT